MKKKKNEKEGICFKFLKTENCKTPEFFVIYISTVFKAEEEKKINQISAVPDTNPHLCNI